jgi:hypothetical protein
MDPAVILIDLLCETYYIDLPPAGEDDATD